MYIDALNQLFGTLTLGLQVATVASIVALIFRSRVQVFDEVVGQLARLAFPAAFLLALGSSIITLYYSDILGFDPCALCWWQRVFLYPQIVILAIALWRKDTKACAYIFALSVFGFLVSIYHHALQMFPAGALPCPASGPSCSQITILEYGYITFPLMAATLFAFLIVLMLAHRAKCPRT
jgi:disulfide bond formation protein DsbB